MSDRSFPVGPIRPPSEAGSLLLKITDGCTWNQCRFCVVYRGQPFHVLSPDEVKRNIDNMVYFRDLIYSMADDNGRIRKEVLYEQLDDMNSRELECFYMVYNWLQNGGRTVFLQDGNSVALKPEKLAEILFYLKKAFPSIQRITSYGRAESISRWSVNQLKLLRSSGLNRIHSGFESGSDPVLQLIHKGLTQEQQILAGQKTKEAGIELSMYFMPGIGGKEYTEENALETAKVVNLTSPDYVRLRTFVLKTDSEMWTMKENGSYTECTDIEKLQEIRSMLAAIEAPDVTVVSDHIVNLIGSLGGRIGDRRQAMLDEADAVLTLPLEEQRTYQLARRHGLVDNYPQLLTMSEGQRQQLREAARRYTGAGVWEHHLNEILRQYV